MARVEVADGSFREAADVDLGIDSGDVLELPLKDWYSRRSSGLGPGNVSFVVFEQSGFPLSEPQQAH